MRSWWQPIPYVAAVSGGLVKASGLCSAGLGWAGGCKLVQVQLRHRRGEVASVASNHQQLPGEHRHLARAEPDPATMDRSFDVKSSSVRKLCRFVLATSYNKQVPQICRWLMDHDQVNRQTD